MIAYARLRTLAIFGWIVLCTLLLDQVVFGRLIFAPANRTSWDSFPWYNFEHQVRRMAREREATSGSGKAGRPLVLVVGSSIAKYSVQKFELERALAAAGYPDANVELFTHAAMLPTDLYYYTPRLRALRPDLIVYITGPADMDLERYAAPYEIVGAGSPESPGFVPASARRFVATRHPMLILYPGAFAADHCARLDTEDCLRLGFRQWFYSLRFQQHWRDSLEFNLNAGYWKPAGEPIVSYLNYQGIRIPEGLWREGHSVSQFSFALRDIREAQPKRSDRIRLEVPAELVAIPDFQIKIYARPPSTKPTVAPQALATYRPERAGWQDLPLPRLPDRGQARLDPETAIITVQLSHVLAYPGPGVVAVPGPVVGIPKITSDPVGRRAASFARPRQLTIGRGVRLPANFGRLRLPVGEAYVRHPAWEDWRLETMSESEYVRDFETRIWPANWRAPEHIALHQLNRLRIAKYYSNWYRFDPTIRQARDLKRFTTAMQGESRILLINNPENPLTLPAYNGNAWYRGYVEYLQGLDRQSAGQVRFVDHRADLPMTRFLDTHHLTYGGLEEMAPVYARHIAGALE